MASINKVILVGSVGKDPEIRNTTTGKKIANFSLATSESWKDANGERKEQTEWHKVVVFNEGLAKVVENYVKKGSKLYVEGKLTTRKYEKDGVERYTTEVVLQNFNGNIVLLDNKQGTSEKVDEYKEPVKTEVEPDFDDEIPF